MNSRPVSKDVNLADGLLHGDNHFWTERRLLDLHGASGFGDANPLQRFWRDVEVGTRYAGLNPFIAAEDHGRLLLDVERPVSMTL